MSPITILMLLALGASAADPAESKRLAWTPTELAPLLGCSRQHIQNMIARGEIQSVKFGGKRLIARAEVE